MSKRSKFWSSPAIRNRKTTREAPAIVFFAAPGMDALAEQPLLAALHGDGGRYVFTLPGGPEPGERFECIGPAPAPGTYLLVCARNEKDAARTARILALAGKPAPATWVPMKAGELLDTRLPLAFAGPTGGMVVWTAPAGWRQWRAQERREEQAR